MQVKLWWSKLEFNNLSTDQQVRVTLAWQTVSTRTTVTTWDLSVELTGSMLMVTATCSSTSPTTTPVPRQSVLGMVEWLPPLDQELSGFVWTFWKQINNSRIQFQNFLYERRQDHHLYLGATDSVKEGSWVWDDGHSWSWESWKNGEPNGETTENCLVLHRDSNKFVDVRCSYGYRFICQTRECHGQGLGSCCLNNVCPVWGGHCSGDDQCSGSLRCGHKNCALVYSDAHKDANCCAPHCPGTADVSKEYSTIYSPEQIW